MDKQIIEKKKDLSDIELDDLTPSQQKFVINYLESQNAAKAYRACHPKCSYETSRVEGSRTLSNHNVSAFVKKYFRKLWEQKSEQIGNAFSDLVKIARSDIYSVADFKNGDLVVRNFSESETAVIKKIVYTKKLNKEGGYDINASVELHDKVRAISELAKILGMIKEQEEGPIKVKIIPAVRPPYPKAYLDRIAKEALISETRSMPDISGLSE